MFFDDIPLDIKGKLTSLGIQTPTKVQNEVMPLITDKKNVVFQSETGTGKTLAYSLPLILKLRENLSLNENQSPHIKIIIVSPTFELSSQIKQMIMSISDVKIALLLGGGPIKRQIETLKEKPEIVVGTVSRINELIALKKLKTQNIQALVFDEADRLLKKEIFLETEKFFNFFDENVQKIACSATIDKKTQEFFSASDNFEFVTIPPENILTKSIEHWAIYSENRDKIETLKKFLMAEKPEKTLIFTSRPDRVENIKSKLLYKKIDCSALYAKMDRQERKSAIDKFKSGKIKILITSDLCARGLDIPNITHIIQMDLPSDKDFFIHRAGRTARAGKQGINVVIGDEYEMRQFSLLEKKLKITVYPKEIRAGKVLPL